MNSMFSSFDALSAESLGLKLRSPFALATMDCNSKRVLNGSGNTKVAEDKLIKNQEGSSSRSLTRKQGKKMPRFAPELDGLNCFETILSNGLLLLPEIWGDQDFLEEIMNSMFSSFDALSAEFLGLKVRSSFALATMDCNSKRVLNGSGNSKVAEDKLIKNQEGSSTRSFTRKQEKKMPRFAPELDGLNCFETILLWPLELALMEVTTCGDPKIMNEQLISSFHILTTMAACFLHKELLTPAVA
ncbi:unnamed protein product [Dovyalis caffra]|uniref:Uncharacterized protein n=1 Tax=Dovyalis caffra TaxID=77055 RepID=A0AAV1SWD5_9ROSI|nr:unnamed protein product [Dovyalis caffra]